MNDNPTQQQQDPSVQQVPVATQPQPAQTVTIGGKEGVPVPITAAGEQGSSIVSEVGPQKSPDISAVVEQLGVKETIPHAPQIAQQLQNIVKPGSDAITVETLNGNIPHDFKILLEEPESAFLTAYKKEKNTTSPMYWILHVAKKLRDRFKQQKLEILTA